MTTKATAAAPEGAPGPVSVVWQEEGTAPSAPAEKPAAAPRKRTAKAPAKKPAPARPAAKKAAPKPPAKKAAPAAKKTAPAPRKPAAKKAAPPKPNGSLPNREEWLQQAAELFRSELFKPAGLDAPPVHITLGWPTGGSAVRGQCFIRDCDTADVNNVFISPDLGLYQTLLTLAHEMVHAIDDCKTGHGKEFAAKAGAIGLVKPWTSSTAGDALKEKLGELAKKLPPFPNTWKSGAVRGRGHMPMPKPGELVPTGEIDPITLEPILKRVGPGSRLLKAWCPTPHPEEGAEPTDRDVYTVRITQKWIERGLPSCGVCGGKLITTA